VNPQGAPVDKISILVIEDEETSQTALRQMLDSEDWQVHIVPAASQALAQLSSGRWSLVIASVATTGMESAIFLTLRELAVAQAAEEGAIRVRVLFVLAEQAEARVRQALEKDRLPYVEKPFQFHDLLEKVSDLLMETGSLQTPIRKVRHDASASERRRLENRQGRESGLRKTVRDTGMFASREHYVMTEEEIADYEKSEREDQEKKRKKPSSSY
jgi:DNA-binding NtrC family response regulator